MLIPKDYPREKLTKEQLHFFGNPNYLDCVSNVYVVFSEKMTDEKAYRNYMRSLQEKGIKGKDPDVRLDYTFETLSSGHAKLVLLLKTRKENTFVNSIENTKHFYYRNGKMYILEFNANAFKGREIYRRL
jgi:hypothetical protein